MRACNATSLLYNVHAVALGNKWDDWETYFVDTPLGLLTLEKGHLQRKYFKAIGWFCCSKTYKTVDDAHWNQNSVS